MTHTLFNLAVIGGRFMLGFIFFTAGMGKLTDGHYFPITIFQMSLAKILAPHGLSLLGEFVAWSQVIIGFLLISQRFATIGAIMCLPLILNIFVVTVALQFRGTVYINAFLVFLNLFLLAADYHKLKFLFMDDVESFKPIPLKRNYWKIDLLWAAALLLCLGAGVSAGTNRLLTYGLSFAGIVVFLFCSVWQYFLQKESFLSKIRLRVIQPQAEIKSE